MIRAAACSRPGVVVVENGCRRRPSLRRSPDATTTSTMTVSAGLARASSAGERAQVAPGSHGHANRDETRRLATPANPRHYAQTRMNRPLLTFMVGRGSPVRVRKRASKQSTCTSRCSVACIDALGSIAGTRRVHISGRAGTRGQGRRLVSPCDTLQPQRWCPLSRESPCTGISCCLAGRDDDSPPCRERSVLVS
jgi:hypothetical protein